MEPKEVRWQVRWLYVRAWWGTKLEMLIFQRFLYVFERAKGEGTLTFPPGSNQVTFGEVQ